MARRALRIALSGAALAIAGGSVLAQDDAVVVTATRAPRPALEIPASVDRLYAEDIRAGRRQVDLSESLGAVPGIVVQNRHNYAQDLQISSRGFGARASFGVRGIRLLADGIPLSMPDGQGQAASFALGSAERIEVLRGPFSALYGNSAGGVIVVDTEAPPGVPLAEARAFAGSDKTWQAALKAGRPGALGELSHFETGGHRSHSAARRDQLNAKLESGRWTLVLNALAQPEAQDPGGLDRAAFAADPRQAGPNAVPFDTRKRVSQEQAGLRLRERAGPGTLEASVYAGQRDVLQFLGFAGDAGLSSGGVVELDRTYGGGALRYAAELAPFRLALGLELERMDERRRGFVNEAGVAGALRRDEDDAVSSSDLYAQAEWRFAERWRAHGGLRASRVRFEVTDFFIGGANPDDSGTRTYTATTPVAGLVYRPAETVSVYASLGRGFETPTLAELAHRPGASGFNFALAPAKSRHAELGAKLLTARYRANIAVFDIETADEIVVASSAGGRTTFRNAGRTERRGFELSGRAMLAPRVEARAALTLLDAELASGAELPGVPRGQLFGALGYRGEGWRAELEALARARVPVNDANSEYADAYGIANAVLALERRAARWRLGAFLRVDNLADRAYAGSVIVNESNGRYYEPAPGRSVTLGVQAALEL